MRSHLGNKSQAAGAGPRGSVRVGDPSLHTGEEAQPKADPGRAAFLRALNLAGTPTHHHPLPSQSHSMKTEEKGCDFCTEASRGPGTATEEPARASPGAGQQQAAPAGAQQGAASHSSREVPATQQQLLEDPQGDTWFLAGPGTPCSIPAQEQLQKSDLLGEKPITVSGRPGRQGRLQTPRWGREASEPRFPSGHQWVPGAMGRGRSGSALQVLSAFLHCSAQPANSTLCH